MSLAMAFAGLCGSASAAITIVATETTLGMVWSFSGSVSGAAGTSSVSESVFGAANGYSLAYTTRGDGAPRSTITVGYGGSVNVPYFKSVASTAWSFLAKDSLETRPTTPPAQQTINLADNVVAMTFRSVGSDTTAVTELYLLGNSQNMVLDRTIFIPGLTLDDLNLTVDLDTEYSLSGGNTIEFVSVPELGSPLLTIISGGLITLRRRRKAA
jgi:hypothetical protein